MSIKRDNGLLPPSAGTLLLLKMNAAAQKPGRFSNLRGWQNTDMIFYSQKHTVKQIEVKHRVDKKTAPQIGTWLDSNRDKINIAQ